jgi:hypothetical protein
MTSYSTLLVETTDNILILRLNRPDALNALNTQMFDELKSFFAMITKHMHSDLSSSPAQEKKHLLPVRISKNSMD